MAEPHPDRPLPLEVSELTKAFAGHVVVDSVSLLVREGEIVMLLGANGAGKSTILRMIAGTVTPEAGSIHLEGIDVTRERRCAAARAGTLLAGEGAWYPRLSGRDNLEFFGVIGGLSRGAAAAAAAKELAELRLDRHADRAVSSYSRGMRARLGLARARLADPPILLLDEPTANLDARSIDDLTELLRRERSRRAVLLATHSSSELAELGDRAFVLHEGQIADELEGPLQQRELAAALAAAA